MTILAPRNNVTLPDIHSTDRLSECDSDQGDGGPKIPTSYASGPSLGVGGVQPAVEHARHVAEVGAPVVVPRHLGPRPQVVAVLE